MGITSVFVLSLLGVLFVVTGEAATVIFPPAPKGKRESHAAKVSLFQPVSVLMELSDSILNQKVKVV